MISIATTEQALAFIESQSSGGAPCPPVSFSGELAEIKILIQGSRYHGTLPGDLSKGLWELQEAIYKAAAYALNGPDGSRRLTTEQRQGFELVFEIREGSTDIVAKLEEFLHRIADGLTDMSDANKSLTLVLIAVVLTTGYGASTVVEGSSAAKIDEIKAGALIATEQEKTKQFQILADALSANSVGQRFAQASDEGARAVIRGAPDATSVSIGRVKFSSSEIHEINQRAPKVKSEALVIQEDFSIFGAETRHGSSTRYTLGRRDGSEFSVTVNHDDFMQGDLDRLWAAARDRKGIKLEVNLTLNRGAIRSAQIVQIL